MAVCHGELQHITSRTHKPQDPGQHAFINANPSASKGRASASLSPAGWAHVLRSLPWSWLPWLLHSPSSFSPPAKARCPQCCPCTEPHGEGALLQGSTLVLVTLPSLFSPMRLMFTHAMLVRNDLICHYSKITQPSWWVENKLPGKWFSHGCALCNWKCIQQCSWGTCGWWDQALLGTKPTLVWVFPPKRNPIWFTPTVLDGKTAFNNFRYRSTARFFVMVAAGFLFLSATDLEWSWELPL